jgi:hypothetical protein
MDELKPSHCAWHVSKENLHSQYQLFEAAAASTGITSNFSILDHQHKETTTQQ